MGILMQNDKSVCGGVTRSSELKSIDTQGIIGTAGATVNDQAMLDELAERSVSHETSLANKELRFFDVAVSATTGNIISISGVTGEKITASHVLDWVRFSNPSAITVMKSWTTANGSFVINGTCVAANVTADIKLSRVD